MNLFLKATAGVLLMMWIRWTLPRLRIDQVMTTCLKYCTPIARHVSRCHAVAVIPAWWARPRKLPCCGRVREGWLEESYRKESAEDESLSLKGRCHGYQQIVEDWASQNPVTVSVVAYP